MADLYLHIRIDRRLFRWGVAGIVIALAATDLSSEKVTLSTYYPAPSGVYTNMITTGNTFLARDGGNVGVGTFTPKAKLDVNGIVRVGNVSGATDPAGGAPGMIYYNTTSRTFRGYQTAWSDLGAALPVVCYCLWCHEGENHDYGGGWKCTSAGVDTAPSDDGAATQGCRMKIKLVPAGTACSWATPSGPTGPTGPNGPGSLPQ